MSGASPIRAEFRQAFAWLSQTSAKDVATADMAGQISPAAGRLSGDRCICCDLAPSPFSRSVPLVERPGLSCRTGCKAGRGDGHGIADAAQVRLRAQGFCFIDASAAVSSRTITTQRGNEPCVSILSSSHLRPPHLPAACRPQGKGLPLAASLAWRQPMLWMKTWSQVACSARPQVRAPACCPAQGARLTDLNAALPGRTDSIARPSGHAAPVAFVISAPRPGRGGRGERCSRRS